MSQQNNSESTVLLPISPSTQTVLTSLLYLPVLLRLLHRFLGKKGLTIAAAEPASIVMNIATPSCFLMNLPASCTIP